MLFLCKTNSIPEKMKKSNLAFIILILSALILAGFFYKRYNVAPNIAFQDLVLQNETGKQFGIKDFMGQTIVLNFYQSWCGPCIREMPIMENIKKTLPADKVVFLAVTDEPFAKINFVKGLGNFSFNFLQMTANRKDFGIYTIPTTYFINPEGEIIFEKVGEVEWTSPEVLDLLKK